MPRPPSGHGPRRSSSTEPRRRDVLERVAGVAAGVVAAGCATGPSSAPRASAVTGSAPGPLGIPGPYPGRVVQVDHAGCLRDGRIDQAVAGTMLARAMGQLTDAADAAAAWRRLFAPGDRVGLKVNCVGHPTDDPSKHAVYTSHEILREVVAALRVIGVRDFVLFDRYRMEFTKSGYPQLADELQIPWETSSISWDQSQIDLAGYSQGDPFAAEANGRARTDGSPKVSGYDPDVFVTLGFTHPVNDPANPRAFRSHVANVVTRKVDKIINFCLIKDHVAAGITGALKNLSHGLVDNVCRSHSRSALNQTATFIPAVVAMPIIRQKVVLNVMEGFRGIYHNGPWASPYVFEPRTLLVSTDPVAMDRIAMGIIDARRAEAGLPSVLAAGKNNAIHEHEQHLYRGATHVELAGAAGLGVFPLDVQDWERWIGQTPEKARSKGSTRALDVIRHERVRLG